MANGNLRKERNLFDSRAPILIMPLLSSASMSEKLDKDRLEKSRIAFSVDGAVQNQPRVVISRKIASQRRDIEKGVLKRQNDMNEHDDSAVDMLDDLEP